MPNITISLDEELIKRGREYAAKHNTSINALIRKYLQQTVESQTDDWLAECFELMNTTGADSKGKQWEREDLYDV